MDLPDPHHPLYAKASLEPAGIHSAHYDGAAAHGLEHRVLAARLPGVASKTVLSYLPVMSDIFAYLVVLPPLSLLVTGQKARRCFGLGALTLLALYLADLLLLLFFWVLWFPDRQLELSMALLPSDSRVVMLMAVQSIMYLLLLALHLASQPQEAPPGVVSASFPPVGRRRLQPAAVLPDPPVRQIRDHDGTAVYGGIQFAAGNLY